MIPFRVKLLTDTAKTPEKANEGDLWDLFADNFKDKTVFINGYGVCYKCKNRKEENQFCSDKRKLNGKTNICLECERKRGREKYLRRKLNLYLNWH